MSGPCLPGIEPDDSPRPAPRPIAGSAIISECGRYRYRLVRAWDESLPPANFVMLNPSTADATEDDPTIRRCLRYARDWGHGSLVVTNLFAWRATDPRELRTVADPVGPENDDHTIEAAIRAVDSGGIVVCAWGVQLGPRARRDRVVELLRGAGVVLHAVATSGAGHPMHPLYLRADLLPVGWLGPISRPVPPPA